MTPDVYIDNSKEKTKKCVEELKKSRAYTYYLQNKSNPNSFYNREMDDVSSIILSDDSDKEDRW